MNDGLSRKDKRAMFYVFSALISLGIMGAVAEFMSSAEDLSMADSWKGRLGSIIAFSLFTFLLCAGAAVVAIVELSGMIELILVVIAFLTNTVALAIATSPESDNTQLGALLLWAVELFLVAALFYLRGDMGGNSKGDTKASTSTPAYNPNPVSMGAPYSPSATGASAGMPPPPPPKNV